MTKRVRSGPKPQPGQPVSLRTLGEYLKLSPATISLVLNNAPGVRSIPQDTRDRVIGAAAKFDSRPSFYARSFRKRQTFSIVVLVPDLNDNYVAQVLTGMEELLIEEGYFYLIVSHRRKPDLIDEYPRLLMDRCLGEFILIDTVLEHGLKLPVVSVAGHKKIKGVTNVVLDQRRAAELCRWIHTRWSMNSTRRDTSARRRPAPTCGSRVSLASNGRMETLSLRLAAMLCSARRR
jgi:LacI family transcriptional regulator